MTSAHPHGALEPVVEALVASLPTLPAFAGFTVTDRASFPDELPAARVAAVRSEPWSTGSSAGSRTTLTLSLATRTGSFGSIHNACSALSERLAGDPLSLSSGQVILQEISGVTRNQDAARGLEIADLTLTFLIDCGDL